MGNIFGLFFIILHYIHKFIVAVTKLSPPTKVFCIALITMFIILSTISINNLPIMFSFILIYICEIMLYIFSFINKEPKETKLIWILSLLAFIITLVQYYNIDQMYSKITKFDMELVTVAHLHILTATFVLIFINVYNYFKNKR